MSLFTKTLHIHTQDLGVNATLLLTFNTQNMTGLYTDCFPTAWKVTSFGATGPYYRSATYSNQLAFFKAQDDLIGDIVSTAATWVNLNVGQSTTLTEADNIFSFSSPVQGSSKGYIQAWNKTSALQDIGLGFNNKPGSPPTPLLYFTGVSFCIAQFTPTVSAYIVTGYQENQILRGAIETPAIWTADLAALTTTSFTLSRDPITGKYSLTPDLQGVPMNQALSRMAYLGNSELDQLIQLFNKQKREDSDADKVKANGPATAQIESLTA